MNKQGLDLPLTLGVRPEPVILGAGISKHFWVVIMTGDVVEFPRTPGSVELRG